MSSGNDSQPKDLSYLMRNTGDAPAQGSADEPAAATAATPPFKDWSGHLMELIAMDAGQEPTQLETSQQAAPDPGHAMEADMGGRTGRSPSVARRGPRTPSHDSLSSGTHRSTTPKRKDRVEGEREQVHLAPHHRTVNWGA